MIRLGELISWLEKQDGKMIVPFGFGNPASYRGYYEEVAFEPDVNASFSDMLFNAKTALGNTFIGYKGGSYTMNENTPCWICKFGNSNGLPITSDIFTLWESTAEYEQGN